MRLLIIGAVAAGTSAAAKASRNDSQASITIYERDSRISYSGCGLPYFISGQVPDIATLVPRGPDFFKKKYGIEVLTRHEVLQIDPGLKSLQVKDLTSGRIFTDHYDKLILATGASAVIPPVPGADQDFVFTLRNPGDALAIRGFVTQRQPKTALILGSGFIGLEMVESLSSLGLQITLIEKLPQICPSLDPEMAARLQTYLEEQAVTVLTGRTLTKIGNGQVLLDNGERVAADMVLLAAGIRPAVELARQAGIQIGLTGAIAVDTSMRTSQPDIFACGDCCESFSIVDGRPLYRPLGSTANKTGRIAGDVASGGSLTFRGIAGTGIFKVFDLAVASCGLREQEAADSGYDVVTSLDSKSDKPHYFGGREMTIKAIADRSSGKLLGAQIIGFAGVDRRMDVFVTAMTGGLTADQLSELDLAYAPPFANARDPVHFTGMILQSSRLRPGESSD
jgi:NADPH-dependent 2,4-dienoyl-CoA reductase/sulfur reductase-like enzyme